MPFPGTAPMKLSSLGPFMGGTEVLPSLLSSLMFLYTLTLQFISFIPLQDLVLLSCMKGKKDWLVEEVDSFVAEAAKCFVWSILNKLRNGVSNGTELLGQKKSAQIPEWSYKARRADDIQYA